MHDNLRQTDDVTGIYPEQVTTTTNLSDRDSCVSNDSEDGLAEITLAESDIDCASIDSDDRLDEIMITDSEIDENDN